MVEELDLGTADGDELMEAFKLDDDIVVSVSGNLPKGVEVVAVAVALLEEAALLIGVPTATPMELVVVAAIDSDTLDAVRTTGCGVKSSSTAAVEVAARFMSVVSPLTGRFEGIQAPFATDMRAAMERTRLLFLRYGRNCMVRNECRRLVECSLEEGKHLPFDVPLISLRPYPVVSVMQGL